MPESFRLRTSKRLYQMKPPPPPPKFNSPICTYSVQGYTLMQVIVPLKITIV